jgi:curli biogenesis system outer membrane secretion channel CsgG
LTETLRATTRRISRLGAIATVAMTVALAGCTTSAAGPTGVVTGVAYACQGLALPPGEILHVRVSLYSGSSLVASETVRSGTKYRFSVSPGSYCVTGWWGFKGVTVRAGRIVTASFWNICI